MKIKRGSTSVRRLIFVADSSSTTGAGLANLTYNSASLVAYYFAGDLSNEVSITLATATLGTYTSGGFVAVDNTNMPGWYEIGIPDAALDGGNECAVQLRGAANMVPVNIYIELDAIDYQGTPAVDVTKISGDSTAADNAEAFFDGTGYDGTNNIIPTVTTLTNLPAITAGWLTSAGIAADAINAAKIAADAVTEIQSGLASQTSVDTLASYVDTEVAAIKAKTDNLPTDPADQSAVEAAITAATSGLASQSSVDTLASYVDTEVAAIKAKTDNLPADPADASDISASFSSLASSIATLAAYVDTEVAAIKAKTDNLPTDPADQSAVEAAITAAVAALATAANLAAVATELAKVPKSGETRRYTQIAANAGAKTADVSIGVPL